MNEADGYFGWQLGYFCQPLKYINWKKEFPVPQALRYQDKICHINVSFTPFEYSGILTCQTSTESEGWFEKVEVREIGDKIAVCD